MELEGRKCECVGKRVYGEMLCENDSFFFLFRGTFVLRQAWTYMKKKGLGLRAGSRGLLMHTTWILTSLCKFMHMLE